MMRKLIPLFLVALVAAILAVPASASATLLPVIGGADVHDTASLRAGLKARPDIASKLVNVTGGGVVNRSQWEYCGVVTPSQRAELVRKGYKNTAYNTTGGLNNLGSLKAGALVWACRTDTRATESSLRKQVGPHANCKTKTYKSGTITVVCSSKSSHLVVKAPARVKRVPIGRDCFNPQLTGKPDTTEITVTTGVYTAWRTITVKKGESITCGGATATAIATARARGFGYGRTRAAAIRMAKRNATASVKVSGICKKVTAPPPSGGQSQTAEVSCPQNTKKVVDSTGQVICQIQQLQCSAGWVMNSAGFCVQQGNNAELNCTVVLQGTFNGDTQFCTIIQINANCSNVIVLNSTGEVVSSTQGDNCNVNPPPPPVNRPPTVQILNLAQHIFVSGQAQFCATASDPDGDSLMVTWYAVRGTVSTAFRPDPNGNPTKWCTRYTAPPTAGPETISVSVSDGEFTASDGGPIPYGIVADQF